jgi:hypothetical protein
LEYFTNRSIKPFSSHYKDQAELYNSGNFRKNEQRGNHKIFNKINFKPAKKLGFIKRFKIINQYFSLTFIQYNANFKKNSGCGFLVGSLLAIYLRKGHTVHIYDRSPDIRQIQFSGRSINLAMSTEVGKHYGVGVEMQFEKLLFLWDKSNSSC